MSITDAQLKGNWGEQFIAYNLSAQGCFIRHVPQGHDSGIDLYCETIKDGMPFLHFWCQVKTSQDWKGTEEQVSFRPEERHVQYWLNQPVPVFIFLVPDIRDEADTPYYIARVFDLELNRNKLESHLKVQQPKDLSIFFDTVLPVDTYLWGLKDGIVRPLPTPKRTYIRQTLTGVSHIFEKRIQRTILDSLDILINDIIFQATLVPERFTQIQLGSVDIDRIEKVGHYVKALETIVLQENDRHYHFYETIGIYYEFRKEYDKAKQNYETSLNLLNEDPKSQTPQDPWRLYIERVEEHINRVKDKLSQEALPYSP